MTNLPPPDPQSSERRPLGFDDFVGILVAFATIGGIFFWVLSRRNEGFRMPDILSLSQSPSIQPILTPSPQVTETPESVLPSPTASPTLLPTPTPSAQTPVGRGFPLVVPLLTEAPPTPTASAPPTPAPDQPVNFVDVPDDYWARPFINALAQRRIISGYAGDYFRPNQPVTRAEFAAILQDAFEQSPGGTSTEYQDVPPSFWAAQAIDRATQAGFVTGYPGNIFRPEQEITRAQVLVALATGLKLSPANDPTQVLQFYQDAAQIPNYATQQVAAATSAGLVVNYPEQNVLNPNASASRAEVAAIVYQALVDAGRLEPIENPYIVPSSPEAPEASPPPVTSPSPEASPPPETTPSPEASPSS